MSILYIYIYIYIYIYVLEIYELIMKILAIYLQESAI